MTQLLFRLEDDQLEHLADLFAQRLGQPASAGRPLVDATEIARLLGVSRSSVYENAQSLGAIRIGEGKSGRLRFDPEVSTRTGRNFTPEPAAAAPGRPGLPRRSKRQLAAARHPFLEPMAVWDGEAGLWRDATGYPTRDQYRRSPGMGTQGPVAQGPSDETGATHAEWEASRRAWRKEHRPARRPGPLDSALQK